MGDFRLNLEFHSVSFFNNALVFCCIAGEFENLSKPKGCLILMGESEALARGKFEHS